MKRLRALFVNVPGLAVWASVGIGLLLLLLVSFLLDRIGIAPWHPDFTFLLGLGAVAGLATSLGEETSFRGLLLRPPPEGRSVFVPAALSAFVFALWHPAQTFLYDPLWEPYAWSWWILGGTGLLGFACACLTLSTRSLWPAVAVHLLVALGWKSLYGIPSCGFASCALPA